MKILKHTAKLSFYAFLSATTLWACTNALGHSNMREGTEEGPSSREEIDYIELERRLNEASTNLSSAKGKDFILVLGNTDSGKSTLINYLQGHQFFFFLDEETESRVLIRDHESKVPYKSPEMGQSYISCTLLPEIYQLDEQLFACDTAGFADTRGLTKEAISYLGLQMAVKAADRIRAIVAVVEESQLESQKGSGFRSIAQVLQAMFRGDSYHSSLFLLFNKGKKSQKGLLGSMRQMQTQMQKFYEKDPNAHEAQSHLEIASVLDIFCKTGNVYPFSPCDSEFRKLLFGRIYNSTPIPSESIGIASSTRYSQVLDRVLCEIGLQGNQIIRTMQATNAAMSETISDTRHTRGIIAQYSALIDEKQENIAREKARIKKEELSIMKQRERLMDYDPILQTDFGISDLTHTISSLREDICFKEKNLKIYNALLLATYDTNENQGLINLMKNKQNTLCVADQHASSCDLGVKSFGHEWRIACMNLACIRETVSYDMRKVEHELTYCKAREEDAKTGSEYGYREYYESREYDRRFKNEFYMSDIKILFAKHKLMVEKECEGKYLGKKIDLLYEDLDAMHLILYDVDDTDMALSLARYQRIIDFHDKSIRQKAKLLCTAREHAETCLVHVKSGNEELTTCVNIECMQKTISSEIKNIKSRLTDLEKSREATRDAIKHSKEKLAHEMLNRSEAELGIKKSKTSIANSEALVRSYHTTITDTEDTIARLSNQAAELNQRFSQLINQMNGAKLGLRELEDQNKIKMLYTICQIMQPKLEVVDEFMELHHSVPRLLETHELLISEMD